MACTLTEAQGGSRGRMPRWWTRPLFDSRTHDRSCYESRFAVQSCGPCTVRAERTERGAGESYVNALGLPSERFDGDAGSSFETRAANPISDALGLKSVAVASTVYLGGSSLRDEDELDALQVGSADLQKRGFSGPDNTSLLLSAAPPAFKGIRFDTHVKGERDFEAVKVEELQAGAGFGSDVGTSTVAARVASFRTSFGIHNRRGSFDQYFVDAPLATSRLLGENGLSSTLGAEVILERGPLMRFHLGIQKSDVSNMDPFESPSDGKVERQGGRPRQPDNDAFFGSLATFARYEQGFEIGDAASLTAGLSGVWGPNDTGPDGETLLLGADVHVGKRVDPANGDDRWSWFVQGELIYRRYAADDVVTGGVPVSPGATLEDWGGYLLYMHSIMDRYGVGLRADWLSGEGDSLDASLMPLARNADPYRDDRVRLSIIGVWVSASAGVRLRVQYSYDDAEHLAEPAHLFWLAFDGAWGFER